MWSQRQQQLLVQYNKKWGRLEAWDSDSSRYVVESRRAAEYAAGPRRCCCGVDGPGYGGMDWRATGFDQACGAAEFDHILDALAAVPVESRRLMSLRPNGSD